jgi:glycerol-3-phosphate acyltransferase PlsY
VNPFLLVVLGYVMGATPTSYWVGRAFHGVDLRTVGSGNLGATNAFRVLGWKAALPVVLFDVGKGFLPAWGFPRLDGPGLGSHWALIYGSAAILGHVFSVWVRFRGGKGVATSAGVFLAVAPWAALLAFLAWILVLATTRIVSLASIMAAVALPLAVFLLPHRGGPALLVFAAALGAFVIWAHRANVGRLLRGEEKRISSSGRGSSGPEHRGGS